MGACLITHVGLSVMMVRKEMGESCEGEINTECWEKSLWSVVGGVNVKPPIQRRTIHF